MMVMKAMMDKVMGQNRKFRVYAGVRFPNPGRTLPSLKQWGEGCCLDLE